MYVTLTYLLTLTAVLSWASEWEEWKVKYGRHYASVPDEARSRDTWMRNMAYIRAHNNRPDVTFTLEINQFGDQDWPREEGFKQHPFNPTPEPDLHSQPARQIHPPPPSFDWRTHGVITPVANQADFHYPAAIAVTECLESLHAIRTLKKELIPLSAQEVVDCCSLYPGVLVTAVYECIAGLEGLCAAGSYPNTAKCENDTCKAVVNDATMTVYMGKGDEWVMVEAVLESPLVYVDASRPSFHIYKNGVYSDPGCSHRLDHALQLVGYGIENDVQFWILKNSWGAEWGMDGYMLMRRSVNMCGVAEHAFQPQ